MDNAFIQEKLLPRLNFNPGLALTGFRTIRPSFFERRGLGVGKREVYCRAKKLVSSQLLLSTGKTQLLVKFKKVCGWGLYKATLNFRKFKVAINSTYRIFLNFFKSCVLPCLSSVDNLKLFHRAVFEL